MNAVIIVAGGKGLRMGADLPKQFLPIGGRPVLMHTIERFRQFDPQMQIVLVLPESQQAYWHSICSQYGFTSPADIANGGATRFHSVLNGLCLVAPGVTLVGVHDGVRPFVSTEVIGRCYVTAQTDEAVIPVIPVVETVRQFHADGTTTTVPRDSYRLVQTPQVFSAALLRQAYEQPFNDGFTDDASVVEAFGHAVTLVEGNRENIKITTPFDLKVAEALL